MKYRSLGGASPHASFPDALLRGMAPDGSLYVPEFLPRLPDALLDGLADTTLHDIGAAVGSLFGTGPS